MGRVVTRPRDPFECLSNQYSKEHRVESDPTLRQYNQTTWEGKMRMASGTDAKNWYPIVWDILSEKYILAIASRSAGVVVFIAIVDT